MPLLLPRIPGRLPDGVTRGLTSRLPLDDASVDNIVRDIVGNNHGYFQPVGGSVGVPYSDAGLDQSRSLKFGTVQQNAVYWPTMPIAATGWTGTISFWLNLDDVNQTAANDGDPRLLCVGTTDSVCFSCFAGTPGLVVGSKRIVASSLFIAGRWQLCTGTYDGTTARLYMDAVDATAVGDNGDDAQPGFASFMGRYIGTGSNRQPRGRMLDLRFYTGTVLTAAEVAQLYYSAFIPDEVMPALFNNAAPPTFLAAWAMNSNLPVIGTGTY